MRTQHEMRTKSPSIALNMFRNGMNSAEIAEQMGISEAHVVDLLGEARGDITQRRELQRERKARL